MTPLDREYDEWLRLFESRDAVATWYAEALAVYPGTWKGWQQTNEAIIRRWSMNALSYIKCRAWKIATTDDRLSGRLQDVAPAVCLLGPPPANKPRDE